MIEFMVIGLPRSGTTWAANWLTTDRTFCVHDPLWRYHYSEFDSVIPARAGERLAGISCSGMWMWKDVLNAHPAKKVILHRPRTAILDSLQRIRMPEAVPPLRAHQVLDDIVGMHVSWRDLFHPERAASIWKHLCGDLPFDVERHTELTQTAVQPKFGSIHRDPELQIRIAQELAA